MPYFKDTQNNIHHLDSIEYIHLLPNGSIEITDEEAELIRLSQLPVIDPQVAINAEALAYLASTDWYVTRFAETGVAIPDDIKTLRQEARDRIV